MASEPAPRSDSYDLSAVSTSWAPAPLGLKGEPLRSWVESINRADGRCQCHEGDCGRRHKTGRCAHVHGIYSDGERQLMSVMANGEVLCGPCVNGMRRMERKYNAMVDTTGNLEGLF